MPIEKEKRPLRDDTADIAKRLQARCETMMLADKQDEQWKIDVADDLNTILVRVRHHLMHADESDIIFARAVLRMVARVAEFEGIRRAK
jgi:hypothetical protein